MFINIMLILYYKELDLCYLNFCMNGGICFRIDFGGFKCVCILGYNGLNCIGD